MGNVKWEWLPRVALPIWFLTTTKIMLQAREEQQEHIKTLCDDLMYANSDGVRIDSYISYDQMASIVDYLRTSDKKDDLFESCWMAYKRKGSKKKSKEYWRKLSEKEKDGVLPHIKAYVSTRELQFQKDFERYLRDKVFLTIVFKDNKVIYDPTRNDDSIGNVYMPTTDGALLWNDYYNCYIYTGWWDGVHISDGYDDSNRPDKATVMLNNGRGTLIWDKNYKVWNKI